MTSDVEVQNPAPSMLDYEEARQELECQRGHGKEIEGDDHLTMVGEESQPVFGRIATAPQAFRYLATARSETSTPSFRSSGGSSVLPSLNFQPPCGGRESESPRSPWVGRHAVAIASDSKGESPPDAIGPPSLVSK
jgi:hypothetical protein